MTPFVQPSIPTLLLKIVSNFAAQNKKLVGGRLYRVGQAHEGVHGYARGRAPRQQGGVLRHSGLHVGRRDRGAVLVQGRRPDDARSLDRKSVV